MRDILGTPATGAWGGGINKAIDPSYLDAKTSPRGLNTALALSRTGTPYIQKRLGMTCRTATALTGSEPILGIYDYYEVSTGTLRRLRTTATRIAVEDSAGAYTVLSTALTSSALPSFATANSLAFIFNGTDAYKVRGTTVENVGITRPTVGTLSGAGGAAGLHNGTYELRVAFKNGNTGHISSASDTASATVVVANKAIDWSNIPVSADSQVTQRLLLVRNTATQAQFYVAGTVSDNVSTTASTSVADANLTTVAPTTTNRNPPVSGIKYAVVYYGRLVLADDEYVYWSPVNNPEAFNPLALDGIDSTGDPITGLAVQNGVLLVFKDDRTFAVYGDIGSPSHTTEQVDANIGCVAHATIISGGGLTYWFSRQGIARFTGTSVDRIGMATFGDPTTTLNMNQISVASACPHDERATLYFAVPDLGQTRATRILPFNYALGVLESEGWDPMDAARLGLSMDANGLVQPVLGSHVGQTFTLWSGHNDGVTSGTSAGGTFTPGTTDVEYIQITDPDGLSLDSNLLERKVTILDADGVIVTPTIRPRIVQVPTASRIQIAPPVALPTGQTYTAIIGGPNFQFDTPWRTNADPFLKKRYEYLFLLFKGEDGGTACSINIAFDWDNLNINGKDRTFTSTSSGAAFDSAIWDTDVWDTVVNVERRYRIARVGKAWRARITNAAVNQPFAMLMIAVQPVAETIKD